MKSVVKTLRIFGRPTEILLDDSVAARILAEELSLYPACDRTEVPSVRVRYGPIEPDVGGLVNPAIHHEHQDGFTARHGRTTVRWGITSPGSLELAMHVATPGSRTVNALRRMKSIQYTTPEEGVGQALHELLLVPSTYFDPDTFLLHAAAFQAPSGGVVVIGGTGGVGKTSLEIELCRRQGYRFVADDIAVVHRSGHVWPNLAYPKIYGYNMVGDPDLHQAVMRGRSAPDHVNWRLRQGMGLSSVRRRVSPERLYGGYSVDGGPLVKYMFLIREHRSDFDVRQVSGAALAALSVPVLKAEYGVFHNHLYWHELNRLVDGTAPIIRPAEVFRRWEELATTALDGADCIVVRGPINIAHRQFVNTVASLVVGDNAD